MKLLDLFCGAGGAAMGYFRAGFTEIVGIDIKPQPRYPFTFIQGDALQPPVDFSVFDLIHASPPCQGYSIMRNLPWLRNKTYPLLIEPTREMLRASGKPWVIENVMGAKLDGNWLCGRMFGRPFYRHRYFESNWFWLAPSHPPHDAVIQRGRNLKDRANKIVYSGAEDSRGLQSWPGRRGDAGHGLTIREATRRKVGKNIAAAGAVPQNGARKLGANVGHAAGVAIAREAMQIDWMRREELNQAIPPAYTQWIGERILEVQDSTNCL